MDIQKVYVSLQWLHFFRDFCEVKVKYWMQYRDSHLLLWITLCLDEPIMDMMVGIRGREIPLYHNNIEIIINRSY